MRRPPRPSCCVHGATGPLLWLFCLLLMLPMGTRADAPTLTIILLPGTSLQDWQNADAPHLHALLAQGALAVMNTRAARLHSDRERETPESEALTLGSGSRTAGGRDAVDFRAPGTLTGLEGVTAAALYQRFMGTAPPPGAWVNPQWPRVLRENTGQGYDIRPGNLGDALAGHGVTVQAGGGRFSYPLACRSDGTVSVLLRFSPIPLGTRTPRLVVWDAGSDLRAADPLLAAAMAQAAHGTNRLLVLSPVPSDRDYAGGRRLSPVLLWGRDVAPGLLYSPSTRRAGLVTNTDVAPSVTAFFGATGQDALWLPSPAYGRPWQVRAARDAVRQVGDLEDEAYRQGQAMKALPALAVLLGVLVLAASVVLRAGRAWAILSVVPGTLVLALLLGATLPQCLLLLAAFTLLATGITKIRNAQAAVMTLAALLISALLGDTLTGGRLMQRGMLGYSAIEGARYYGLGNEAMGALVGASLVLASALWPRVSSRAARGAIEMALLGLAVVLVSPAGGAKAGGVLVAVPAFSVLLGRLSGKALRGRHLGGVLAATALVLGVVVLADMHRGGGQSHVGLAAGRVLHGGLGEAIDVIGRKARVELRLLTRSCWAALLWASVAGLWMLRGRRGADAPGASALLSGTATAVLCCLLFNDAGTVAAALCAALAWGGLMSGIEKPARASDTRSEHAQA